MEGASTPATGAPSAERRWELSDRGSGPVPMTTTQVLQAFFARTVSLYASVRPAGTPNFASPEAFPELAPAVARVPFIQSGALPEQAGGFVVLSHAPDVLLDASRTIRADPAFPRLGFYLPAWIPEPDFTQLRQARAFQLWPGWYLTAILPTRIVKPGSPLVIYLIALNLSKQRDARSVTVNGIGLSPASDAAREFVLEPYTWAVHRLEGSLAVQPGDHPLEFRSTSTGAKVAKSAAVAVASLGMVIYAPGHKGFTTTVRVLDDATAAMLARWEGYAAAKFAGSFEENHADHVVSPAGVTFLKDAVVARYRAYLASSPELVSRLGQAGSGGDPAALEKAVREAAKGFLAREYPPGTDFPKRPTA